MVKGSMATDNSEWWKDLGKELEIDIESLHGKKEKF